MKMINRIWHGWATLQNADAYETLVRTKIFPGIAERGIEGYRGAHLLRRDLKNEVEFVTILWFNSLEAVRNFMGEDYETAYVLPEARAMLSRFQERVAHYQVMLAPEK